MGGFFIGVPLATTIVELPFPRVWITVKDEGVILKGVRLKGQLVAHSDGFWHLLSGKDKELLSLPDEQVCAVRIRVPGAEPTVGKRAMFFSIIGTIGAGIWVIIWRTIEDGWDPSSWGYAIGLLVGLLFMVVAFSVGLVVRRRILRHHSQNKRGEAE